jgi:alkyl sulfatase BDS1-like metallo-beta-lactamase superfamily hydrolase
VEYLALQRDVYLYLHDQTLMMMNQGLVGSEIAEVIELPPALRDAWHAHGYYGTVSHNVKAIYQRYLGWYEGNPARLWEHPPVASAVRYVAAMGGSEPAVAVAQLAFDEGDYRWAAQVLEHVLFADEHHAAARELQADTLEQLGFQAESGTWRSAFLAGSAELRQGKFGTPAAAGAPDIMGALTVSQVFDSIAIRVDGPRAWDTILTISWHITDEDATYMTELRNGVLNHHPVDETVPDTTTFRLSRPTLIGIVTGMVDLPSAMTDGRVVVEGDAADLAGLTGLLAPVDPNFSIVTP